MKRLKDVNTLVRMKLKKKMNGRGVRVDVSETTGYQSNQDELHKSYRKQAANLSP